MHRYVCAIVLLVGLVSCSSGDQMAAAEKEVANFRRLVETQQFAALYANSSPEWQKAASEADQTKLFTSLGTKLGKLKTSEKSGWNVNWHTSGTFVTLGYNTHFEKGLGTETFVFRVSDGQAKLVSYNINSPALLIN